VGDKTQQRFCVLILVTNVEAANFYCAFVGRYKAGDNPDESGFAGGVWAEDANRLAAEKLKAYRVKHLSIGERFA
jgi:hypothetical protein